MAPQAAQMPLGPPQSPSTSHGQSTAIIQEQRRSDGQDDQDQDTKERPRGRRRSREQLYHDSTVTDANWAGTEDGSSAGGPSRKRRRSRKGLDKKFECPQPDCGKSYSRAEHLYRHQLNHDPKQIYNCNFPDCRRSFVRQDLCARHKERHTARGSQLQRKDAFLQTSNSISTATPTNTDEDAMKVESSPDTPTAGDANRTLSHSTPHTSGPLYTSPTETKMSSFSPVSVDSTATIGGSVASNAAIPSDAKLQSRPPEHGINTSLGSLNRSNSDGTYRSGSNMRGYDVNNPSRTATIATYDASQRHSSFGSIDAARFQGVSQAHNAAYARPTLQTSVGPPGMHSLSLSSPYSSTSAPIQGFAGQNQMNTSVAAGPHGSYVAQRNFPPFSTLPPPGYTTMNQAAVPRAADAAYPITSPSTSLASTEQSSGFGLGVPNSAIAEPSLIDQMVASYSVPVFGDEDFREGHIRSPFAMADDFAAWLFNDPNFQNQSMLGRQAPMGPMNLMENPAAQFQPPAFATDPTVARYYAQPIPQQHPMAVNSILDTSLPESLLSEEKRQQLLDLIENRFNETDHAPVRKQKEALLDGDRDDNSHVLSLHMMQTYIGSFWYHFHPQLPILHKPTFAADKTQNILLIAMMAIGASCLDKLHGHAITQASAELSSFLAWHLRWEIFSDADFRPPAKLWIFQALLLLEIYEKMYSTRALHERAHIHHATTLTLMRRGSSLIGRIERETPPSVKDEKQSQGPNGSSNTSGTNTPDDWWNNWITSEATRRAAFAAFVIDSTHATMFGHSAVMVAHEMRLPLPCDEALWSATSSAEVGRVDASLHANGIKPTTFLDGLKKTLGQQSVRTNSFGRTILMAGLLSVSWHMNQRDLQLSSLNVAQALGGRDKWRISLIHAFDSWKRDFDEALASTSDSPSAPYHYSNDLDEENVFESRTVLHHLAHMAMHVDIVDCQIFAGASRLLGRSITPQDYASAQKRMKDKWVLTATARDATFFALRFLSQVLLPGTEHQQQQHVLAGQPRQAPPPYSARDDFLLNRPWVLYFAALIVWSYGYALEGAIAPTLPLLATPEQRRVDMRAFLTRVGGVEDPELLGSVKGRNGCAGLLLVLRDMFRKTRWELLHEAANLLTNCVDMLTSGAVTSSGS
ncbi:MAG: hypothetical protein M1835_007805 [Candelina submexicana]|nr:MAG: hypothetical protein M1835_007805 [Candelina submexicana]